MFIPIQNHFAAFCLPFLLPQNSSSLRHRNLAMPRFRKILRKQNCLTKFQQNEFAWVYRRLVKMGGQLNKLQPRPVFYLETLMP